MHSTLPSTPPDGHVKIAIVGVGRVGGTFAYRLLLAGWVTELVLVDADRQRAEGEAMDLQHAAPLEHPVHIEVGDYRDCRDATVTVITGGVPQAPGQTRLDLADRNAAMFRQIIPQILGVGGSTTILLIVTNPVDVLTYVAWRLSGLPCERVIGSGTVLDSARFRHMLSEHYQIDPRSVHAYVVGEHGDSELPLWSLANIAGMRLDAFCTAHGVPHDDALMDSFFQKTRRAAYEIIARKGATNYAIAAALARIVEAIVLDRKTVLSVSSVIRGRYGLDGDVSLSVPAVIGRGGVERVLNLDLTDFELEQLNHSARSIRDVIARLGYLDAGQP